MELYGKRGQRRFQPPIVFGAGVLWHLLRHGRQYDVVHTASFPYFSLLAAGIARRIHGFRLLVDWHELWTLDYWQGYVGRVPGRIGWLVQRLCMMVPQRAFTPSRPRIKIVLSPAIVPATRGYVALSQWEEVIDVVSKPVVGEGLLRGEYDSGLTHMEHVEDHADELRLDLDIGEIDTTWVVYGKQKRFQGEVIGIPSAELFRQPQPVT